MNELKKKKIEELRFSPKIISVLNNNKIYSISDLCEKTPEELSKIEGMKRYYLDSIYKCLTASGLYLKCDEDFLVDNNIDIFEEANRKLVLGMNGKEDLKYKEKDVIVKSEEKNNKEKTDYIISTNNCNTVSHIVKNNKKSSAADDISLLMCVLYYLS